MIGVCKLSELQCLIFIFVPGHAQIKGNESADSLDDREMNCADILNGIMETGQNEFLDNELDSTSLMLQLKTGVIWDVAISKRYTGSRQCPIKKHSTGTVNCAC